MRLAWRKTAARLQGIQIFREFRGDSNGSRLFIADRHHRACGLRRAADRPSRPVAPAAVEAPAAPEAAARAEGGDRHLRLRHRRHGPSVAPGDDFYAFSNGTWAKNTPIPSDKSNYGMFTMLAGPQPAAHPRHPRRGAKRSRRARSAPPTRASSTRPRSRPRGWRRSSPGWARSGRSNSRAGYAALQAACRAQRHHRPVRRRRRPGRPQERHLHHRTVPGRPRHARPRHVSARRRRTWRRCAPPISTI